MKILRMVDIWLYGPKKRSGSSLSSNAPASDFKPRPQTVGSSVEIEPDAPEPDGDGWIRVKGRDPYRIIKCGQGSEMLRDDHPGRRRTLNPSNPFRNYNTDW